MRRPPPGRPPARWRGSTCRRSAARPATRPDRYGRLTAAGRGRAGARTAGARSGRAGLQHHDDVASRLGEDLAARAAGTIGSPSARATATRRPGRRARRPRGARPPPARRRGSGRPRPISDVHPVVQPPGGVDGDRADPHAAAWRGPAPPPLSRGARALRRPAPLSPQLEADDRRCSVPRTALAATSTIEWMPASTRRLRHEQRHQEGERGHERRVAQGSAMMVTAAQPAKAAAAWPDGRLPAGACCAPPTPSPRRS